MSGIILGVDPGIKNIGFALYWPSENNWRLFSEHYEGAHTGVKVHCVLTKLIARLDVKILAVEALPTLKHPGLMMQLSEVVGGASIVAFKACIKFVVVHPSSWAKAIGRRRGMANEEAVDQRYHLAQSYDEHAAAACGVVTGVLEEGKKIPYGRLRWTDFSSEEWGRWR